MRFLKQLILLGAILCSGVSLSYASHLYGADFFYTYLSGTTYRVTLIAYGDCGGSAFPSFATSTPQVEVYNGTLNTQTVSLAIQFPSTGTEVTPVCPAQLNNTNCVVSTSLIPGVKKFVYLADITLGSASAAWKFRFTGVMGNSSAGRSNSISNINIGGSGSLMVLEATLNNLSAPNSSPTYTVIPTPFFNVNKSANYNPGTVDPNSDSLAYALVPGLEQGGNVTYLTGYTATQPISATTGTFNFNATNGQLSFTPNLVQRSLVVYRVSEYRNGTLIGTSMREMTFVVLPASNNAPSGNISNVSGGNLNSPTAVTVCRSVGQLSFNVSPTDADGDDINVVASGVPAGASLSVQGNNTSSPSVSMSWNVSSATPGTYTFFLTFTDDGCPLSSKQTQAYTIIILPDPVFSFNLISPATCTKKAVFTVNYSSSGTWKVKFYQGATLIDTVNGTTNTITDSLPPGTYTVRVFNSNDCAKDTTIVIANPTTTLINVDIHKPTCNAFSDGAINVTGYNSTAPYQYAMGTGAYSGSGNFTALPAGTYIIHVKDAPGCIKDTAVVLADSIKMTGALTITNVLCHGDNNGQLLLTAANGTLPYKYAINSGSLSSNNNFTNLTPGSYTLQAADAQGCHFDTAATITEPSLLVATPSQVDVDCYGNSTGSITLTAIGGTSPYTYNLNGGAYSSTPAFINLSKGIYVVNVKDANGCIKTQSITLTQPPQLRVISMGIIDPRCFGSSDGAVIVSAAGGVSPYVYSANSQPFTSSKNITGLAAGSYTIHIKDSNSCLLDSVVTLAQPDKLVPFATVAKPTCHPMVNGFIFPKATGGVSPYYFTLGQSAFDITTSIGPLASGVYNLYVRDAHNCTDSTQVHLDDSLRIDGGIALKSVSCYGLSDGGMTLDPTGGIAPYRVAIDNGGYQHLFTYSSYGAGSYTVHIRDTIGCAVDTTLAVPQPAKLKVDTTITHNNCYGASNVGKITLEPGGGTTPYSYAWSNGAQNTREISGLVNGVYSATVTDSNGCKESIQAEVKFHDCCTPMIPSAFTPNGDGKNDLFHVLAGGEMELKLLTVYNRFGQQVFYSDNASTGWDGTLNGSPLDVGTYYYYIKIACGTGGTHMVQLKGDVILIR